LADVNNAEELFSENAKLWRSQSKFRAKVHARQSTKFHHFNSTLDSRQSTDGNRPLINPSTQCSPATAIMATELTVQSERAFQKQPHIFLNSKTKKTKSTKAGKGGRRWFKDVGLGFKTPRTAIEGSYIGT
jgi:hypothetical protein